MPSTGNKQDILTVYTELMVYNSDESMLTE